MVERKSNRQSGDCMNATGDSGKWCDISERSLAGRKMEDSSKGLLENLGGVLVGLADGK